MSRIAPLDPPYASDLQQQFDAIMGGEPPLLLFRTLATSARAWRRFRGGSLLDGDVLSLREREIVINRASARAGCEYEWGVHISVFASAAGLSKEEIAQTLEVPMQPSRWPDKERALIAAVDALHERATLSEAEFQDLAGHFGSDQILEILMLAGFYRTVACIANGLDLPLEPQAARFADYAGNVADSKACPDFG